MPKDKDAGKAQEPKKPTKAQQDKDKSAKQTASMKKLAEGGW
jgi:hypothetical protein